MKNIFLVFIQDLKRISTNVVAIVVLIGLTVIPSLYAWFNTLSNWDPYGTDSTSRIKVAVASDDPGVTIDGVTVNIGDQIISNLKANTTIGWVFTDSTQEAIDGVYSGDYYAALVLPSDFTSDMVSFLSDSLEHPQIQYYCNQKKNAIAPKITDKAKKAVQSQTNSTFVNTLTKSLVSASSAAITVDFDSLTLDDTTGNSLIDVISGKLTDAYNELQTYNVMLDSLISITQISSDVSSLARSSSSDLLETLDTQAGELAALQKLLDANSVSSLSEVSASLSENVSSIRSVMSSISSLYQDMDGDMNTFTDAITQGQENLTRTQQTLNALMTKLSDSIELLNKIASDPEYDFVNEILGSDPQTLADFIASPVEITTKKIYEISAYGSAVSPFYTVLSIWVGGLIMVAIIHTQVKKSKHLPAGVKPYQKFFGRYLTFYCIGQLQTLLIVLGNLFYIQIQCPHPVLYWFACSVTSLVFTIFMYALTVAFGNIGEALAIIFMVVQVAGSGGTFPIDVLPKVYRMIYRYLPFPYAMDALRETIGGMYGNYYWECIGRLFIYIIIAILIGLVLRKPFEQLNHYMERSKENSGVML